MSPKFFSLSDNSNISTVIDIYMKKKKTFFSTKELTSNHSEKFFSYVNNILKFEITFFDQYDSLTILINLQHLNRFVLTFTT